MLNWRSASFYARHVMSKRHPVNKALSMVADYPGRKTVHVTFVERVRLNIIGPIKLLIAHPLAIAAVQQRVSTEAARKGYVLVTAVCAERSE